LASTQRPDDLTGPLGVPGEDAAAAAAGPRFLVVRAGAHRVAIPLEQAREILAPRPVTRLPGSAPWIAGLLNLRGRVLTVVDLDRRLGADAAVGPVVVVEGDGRVLGLRVTAVEAVRMAEGEDQPVEPALSAEGVFRGLAPFPGGLVPVLDLLALQRAALADA
jgi:purine-binding chemotaxis protein CheW